MTLRSLMACAGAVVGLLGAGAAACVIPEPPQAKAPDATAPAAMPTMLAGLAGEWDGALTVRQEKWSSSSVASMSIRRQADGSLLAAWDGFVSGEPAQGMLRFTMKPDAPGPELASYWSHLGASIRASVTASNPDRMVFAGQMKDAGANTLSVEQSLRVIEKDHLLLEMVAVARDGTRTPMLMLDLSRLPGGQRASAAEHLDDAALLARVAAPARAQASVPEREESR